jgi:hypothetical protein
MPHLVTGVTFTDQVALIDSQHYVATIDDTPDGLVRGVVDEPQNPQLATIPSDATGRSNTVPTWLRVPPAPMT